MKKIYLIILSVALIVTVLIAAGQFPSPANNEEPLFCDADEVGRIEIINQFEDGWGEFEQKITTRPVLGSNSWQSPDYYQFIGSDRMLIAFEDGHIIIMAVVEYNCIDGLIESFSLVEDGINQPDGFPFTSKTGWGEVINQYGGQDEARTYAKQIIRAGDLIEFDEWTKVKNVFIR